MNTRFHKSILSTALSAALLLGSATMGSNAFANDKATQAVVDAKQESQIWTTYALSSNLRANNLEVTVHKGKATLTGSVAEEIDKNLAKQIALGVKGVKDVDNQIIVKADYKPAENTSKERSYGQVIDDASITAVVKSKLLWSKNSDGLLTEVDTKSGKVTLSGSADSDAAIELAGQLAKNTEGVHSVDNQLTVKDESKSEQRDKSNKANNDMGNSISDTWITTKVKSIFIYSSNVDGSDISVTTKDGNVTLSGKIGSSAERELAIELAQNIRGVKSVLPKSLTF